MSPPASLIGLIEPGASFRYGGERFTLLRRHKGAPKGKVLVSVSREGGGVAMAVMDDTERVTVVS